MGKLDNLKGPTILECTLRDGSYANDFQFTASDTRQICAALRDAGFTMVEIGHGVGLRASTCGYGEAAETDEAYLKAAAEVLVDSPCAFGMFCIPGIAKLEDIDHAAEHGMDFIRIGTNVHEVDQAAPFVERAKKNAMFVTSNLMKSYALPPTAFAKKARHAASLGVDVLQIVDSAGGMLPEEIDAYFQAVRDVCDVKLGYHGHNNLGLAVAHSLRAIDHGAVIVDSSLQGFGRGGGNAPTEYMVALLKRRGMTSLDPVEVTDISEWFIRPLIRREGIASLDVISGLAQFHSSYMGVIRQYAGRYNVDPRLLIIQVARENKVDAPEELVERLAIDLRDSLADKPMTRFGLADYVGGEQD
jgi:4-hydroxy-2-oxovalerate aldolase